MLKIRVSGTEDKEKELDKSVKHNEKINKIWLENIRPPCHQQKTKSMDYGDRRRRDTNHGHR
jgi:hypothetical protein